MKTRIKRLRDVNLPAYQTPGSIAFDLCSAIDCEVEPQSLIRIPTGLVIETPAGYGLFIYPRSSTPKKKGLLIPHGAGLIDCDYAGDNDEILLQFYNFTKQTVKVKAGERVAQAVVLPIQKVEWDEVDAMDRSDRGGFGGTGD